VFVDDLEGKPPAGGGRSASTAVHFQNPRTGESWAEIDRLVRWKILVVRRCAAGRACRKCFWRAIVCRKKKHRRSSSRAVEALGQELRSRRSARQARQPLSPNGHALRGSRCDAFLSGAGARRSAGGPFAAGSPRTLETRPTRNSLLADRGVGGHLQGELGQAARCIERSWLVEVGPPPSRKCEEEARYPGFVHQGADVAYPSKTGPGRAPSATDRYSADDLMGALRGFDEADGNGYLG